MTATINAFGFMHKYLPSNNGDDSATLLLLHGTGGNEDDLIPLGQRLAPDANTLSLRGNVLENGMPRFFRRIAEGVLDFEDLKFRTAELAEFLDKAAKSYQFDLEKIVAFGYSNGANIAESLLWNYPQLLAGAILIRPMMAIKSHVVPDLANMPVFISGGRYDRINPPGDIERVAEILGAAGPIVKMAMQDAGHEMTREELSQMAEWWKTNQSR
jgi:predicted esterase